MSKRKVKPKATRPGKIQTGLKLPEWTSGIRLHSWVLFLFSFLLYANTLGHDYTQDDAIVIYDNMFTTQGVAGIPGILKNDTFFGFFKEAGKDRLVAGGRYRPFTLILFALEWELFGRSPFIGHLVNILLYCCTVLLLYWTLLQLFHFRKDYSPAAPIAFIAALVFAAHPVHTEVVANIKGRDEIMALLGSLAALYFLLRAYKFNKWGWYVAAAISFFIALLSKENAITFAAIIPLTFFVFTNVEFKKISLYTLLLLVVSLVFLFIRGSVIGWEMGAEPMELMNNPFVKIEANRYVPFSLEERAATILYTLGKYVQLLIFPHPLTHDYYPRHISIMHFSDWQVWLSFALYLVLIIYAIRNLSKKDAISYGILFYLISLSIVSNILFPVGTNMSERFLFMPSVGFSIVFAVSVWYVILKYKKLNWIAGITVLILLLYSIKTIGRNFAWADNFTLFSTDVTTSVQSAKLQNATGGELITQAISKPANPRKEQQLREAIVHLKKAIAIHPNYKNAYLLLGNAYNYLKEYELSIENYKKALQIDPDYSDALNNLNITYREAGRYYGEEKGALSKAIDYLQKAWAADSNVYETARLLGVAHGVAGHPSEAISFFRKAYELAEGIHKADALYNLGSAYYNAGNPTQGAELHRQALQLDPEVAQRMQGK